jgi:hypothetical protein
MNAVAIYTFEVCFAAVDLSRFPLFMRQSKQDSFIHTG